jgi:uncharacterized membrane protein YwaF
MASEPALALFGAAHLGALAATALGSLAYAVTLRNAARRGQRARVRALCLSLALLILVTAGLADARELLHGTFRIEASLPLHLCDLAGFAAAAALLIHARRPTVAPPRAAFDPPNGTPPAITPAPPDPPATLAQRMYELTYYWGLGGTIQALLTPEVRAPFPAVEYWTFFIQHGCVIVAACGLTAGLRLRPRRDSLRWVWLRTAGVAAVVFALNQAIGSNYMYLARPPEQPSIYDYFGSWPWSLATLAIVGSAILALCYAPFAAARAWRERRARHPRIAGPAHDVPP